jgi:hypothetical protein
MFLFASGLSLSYFFQKYEKKNSNNMIYKKVIIRFGKLVFVGLSLSFFSAYAFLEMDEVMLSGILFIGCFFLHKISWKYLLTLTFFINLSYLFLIYFDMTSIFFGHYLGGYLAAIYYFPVMLIGLIIGKEKISNGLWSIKNNIIIIIIVSYFLIFWSLIPINKLTATPSFMMISILFSYIIFALIEGLLKNIKILDKLRYIGKNPLRYWILMYIVFIIPLWFYTYFYGLSLPLEINWIIGVLIAIILISFIIGLSKIFDYITISN